MQSYFNNYTLFIRSPKSEKDDNNRRIDKNILIIIYGMK